LRVPLCEALSIAVIDEVAAYKVEEFSIQTERASHGPFIGYEAVSLAL